MRRARCYNMPSMNGQKLRAFLRLRWQSIILYGGLFACAGVLQFILLGSLISNYSSSEVASYAAGQQVKILGTNPFYLPFYLVEQALGKLMPSDYGVARLSAALFGFLTLIVFCIVLRAWHGRRVAILGTALLGSSSWFLHVARLGTPDVLLFGLFIAFACGVWLRQTESRLAVPASLAIAAVLLYVPGMVWFIALGVLWQWRQLDRIFVRRPWLVSLGALLLAAIVTPLAWAIYHSHNLYKTFLGLPAQGWPKPLTALEHFAKVPFHIFVWPNASPEVWLGKVPMLDIAATAFLCFGVYYYFRARLLARAKVLLTIFVVGGALVSLGGEASTSMFVPFLYLLVAAGVGFLLEKWFVVFPRNPIAKNLAVWLVGIVVGATCTYNIRAYFIAWPQASATQAYFQEVPIHAAPKSMAN